MNRVWRTSIIIRGLMVVLVVGSVGLFLYAPRLLNYWLPGRSITVLAWPQVFDATALKAFEQDTGIKVYIRYFENNEELIVKLEATGGEGYDVVMPGDYAAQCLIEKKLLKRLDKTKLNFLSSLQPVLLHHYFDPHNDYTVPYYWGIYGLGIDTDYFNNTKAAASWALVFDEYAHADNIGMPDSARELVQIAAYYLFGAREPLTAERIQLVKELLIKQKSWVQVYTDLRGDHLLATKTSPVVLILSADIARIMPFFSHIDFVVPQEGSFVIIDSFALSARSEKDALVYQFLNYMYRPETLQHYVDKFGFFPATTTVNATFKDANLALPTEQLFKQLHFFKNTISECLLNDVWVTLKA